MCIKVPSWVVIIMIMIMIIFADKARDVIGKGHPGGEQQGKGLAPGKQQGENTAPPINRKLD